MKEEEIKNGSGSEEKGTRDGDTFKTPAVPNGPLENALDQFLMDWFSGKRPDPAEFCREHSECGPDLRKRIDDFLEGVKILGDEAKTGGGKGVGTILGDFRIIREIGRGGMGRVYEAVQISLNRHVALKVLPPHLSFSDEAVKKFQREAEAGGRQRHPGIVAIYAVGESGGVHYIAQELVEGGVTLADKLKELSLEGVQPPEYFRDAALLIAEVAEAMQHAHDTGVIHRDIKPPNILLTKDGDTKVTDFGLARIEDALALSRTGEFAGTPYYMSPEQAMSRRIGIDHRTDIYSLGVTLYEMLCRKRPFEGRTSQEVLKKVILADPVDPHKTDSSVPKDLSVICLKAMEKAPEKRYQTMTGLADDLRRFLSGDLIEARPVSSVTKLWHRVWREPWKAAALLSSSFVVLALLAIVFLLLDGIHHLATGAKIPMLPMLNAMRVCALNASESPLPLDSLPGEIRQPLEEYKKRFTYVPDPNSAEMHILLDRNRLWLKPAKPGEEKRVFTLTRSGLLTRDLWKIFRSWNLIALAQSNWLNSPDPNLKIEVNKVYDEDQTIPMKTGDVFEPGDQCEIVIQNDTAKIYDISMLFINAAWGVEKIFDQIRYLPGEGNSEIFLINDHQLGSEALLAFAIEGEADKETTDFTWLQQNPVPQRLRGSEDNVDNKEEEDFEAFLLSLVSEPRHRGITRDTVAPALPGNGIPSMMHLQWRVAWPSAQPPDDWRGAEAASLPPSLAGRRDETKKAASDPPDPWRVGSRGALARSTSNRTAPDLLLTGEKRPAQVFIDVTGDLEQVSDLAGVKAGYFEAAFHFHHSNNIAFYDTDNDDTFDLILVDRDKDMLADRQYVLDKGQWLDLPISRHWLSTGYLTFLTPTSFNMDEAEALIDQFSVLIDRGK